MDKSIKWFPYDKSIGCIDAYSTGFLADGSQIVVELRNGDFICDEVVGGKIRGIPCPEPNVYESPGQIPSRIFFNSNGYSTEGVIITGEIIRGDQLIDDYTGFRERLGSPVYVSVYAHFPLIYPDGRDLDAVLLSLREDVEPFRGDNSSNMQKSCSRCRNALPGAKIYRCRRCGAHYCEYCPPKKDVFGKALYDYDGCRSCYYIYFKRHHLEDAENYLQGTIGE